MTTESKEGIKSCWFHKWSKWEQIDIPGNKVIDGKTYPHVWKFQRRSCTRCNYMEEEALNY